MRTSIIHINSYNRNAGNINDFTVYFQNSLFTLEESELKTGKIQIEPIQCVICRSFYAVDIGNNTFDLSSDGGNTWVTQTIPQGNYNVQNFLVFLTNLLPTWLIGWSLQTNSYYYQPPNDGKTYMFRFYNFACSLLGFNIGDTPTITYNNPIYSYIAVNMEHSKVILINCDLPKAKYSSVDNVLTSNIIESNILLKIPITPDSAPWSTLVWRAQSKDIISFDLAHDKIDSIRFWVTDEYGVMLNLVHDWTISFRVTYFSNKDDNSESYLADIADYLHLMVLDKFDKSGSK